MIYFKIPLIFAILLLSPSCLKITKKDSQKAINCVSTQQQELTTRLNLFKKLNNLDLNHRKKIRLPSISKPEEESTLSKIVKSIKNASKNSKYIIVDLRGYRDVDLTNIIISNETDFTLTPFLYSSKYSQGFYSLINISENSITIIPPESLKIFKPYKIYRPDLVNSEIILNISDNEEVFGNMKFSNNIKVSIIADNIKKPFRLDLREASSMQFNLAKRWLMPIYSLKNSKMINSKITTADINYVANEGDSHLKDFSKSIVRCYLDNSNKFSITR